MESSGASLGHAMAMRSGTHNSRRAVTRRGPWRFREASGVTLVEVLVVVAILMMVMAIALPRLMAARKTAQQASTAAFLRNLNVAQTQHYIAQSEYSGKFLELQLNYARLEQNLRPGWPERLGMHVRTVDDSELSTMAFLFLPALQDSSYATGGSPRPADQDQQSGSGGGNGGSGSGSGSGGRPPAARDGSSSGSEGGNGPGGSGGGSGAGSNPSGGSGAPGGNESVSDRLVWQGYEFVLERPTPHTWRCWANPLRDDRGASYYFVDQTGTVRQESGRRASANSNPL